MEGQGDQFDQAVVDFAISQFNLAHKAFYIAMAFANFGCDKPSARRTSFTVDFSSFGHPSLLGTHNVLYYIIYILTMQVRHF